MAHIGRRQPSKPIVEAGILGPPTPPPPPPTPNPGQVVVKGQLSRRMRERPRIVAGLPAPGVTPAPFGKVQAYCAIARNTRTQLPNVHSRVIQGLPPTVVTPTAGFGSARVHSRIARNTRLQIIPVHTKVLPGKLGPPTPVSNPAPFGNVQTVTLIARTTRKRPTTHGPIVLPGQVLYIPTPPASNAAIPVLNPLEMTQVTSPATPGTGTMRFYPKTGGTQHFFATDSLGTEHEFAYTTDIVSTGAPATPIVMSANLVVAAQTQMEFRIPITIGPYGIILGAGAALVGV